MNYIFRWLHLRFLTGQQGSLFEGLVLRSTVSSAGGEPASPTADSRQPIAGSGSAHANDQLAGIIDLGDAPSCSFCGSIMTRNGSCYRCGSCGSTSGCS